MRINKKFFLVTMFFLLMVSFVVAEDLPNPYAEAEDQLPPVILEMTPSFGTTFNGETEFTVYYSETHLKEVKLYYNVLGKETAWEEVELTNCPNGTFASCSTTVDLTDYNEPIVYTFVISDHFFGHRTDERIINYINGDYNDLITYNMGNISIPIGNLMGYKNDHPNVIFPGKMEDFVGNVKIPQILWQKPIRGSLVNFTDSVKFEVGYYIPNLKKMELYVAKSKKSPFDLYFKKFNVSGCKSGYGNCSVEVSLKNVSAPVQYIFVGYSNDNVSSINKLISYCNNLMGTHPTLPVNYGSGVTNFNLCSFYDFIFGYPLYYGKPENNWGGYINNVGIVREDKNVLLINESDIIIGKSDIVADFDPVIRVEDEENNKIPEGVKKVKIFDNMSVVLEFDYNFSSENILNLSDLEIIRNKSLSKGNVIIRGLNLGGNKTKSVILDRKANTSGVCVKDEEIIEISEISGDCSGDNEYWVECPSNMTVENGYVGTNGGYSCENRGLKLKISGLKHSGVIEMDEPSEQHSSSGGGGGGHHHGNDEVLNGSNLVGDYSLKWKLHNTTFNTSLSDNEEVGNGIVEDSGDNGGLETVNMENGESDVMKDVIDKHISTENNVEEEISIRKKIIGVVLSVFVFVFVVIMIFKFAKME